jgi:hypothetical protein
MSGASRQIAENLQNDACLQFLVEILAAQAEDDRKIMIGPNWRLV